MTQHPEPETVKVEQVDRDAAANLIGKIGLSWSGDMIRAGKSDNHDYVKAFARHRLAAISDRQTAVGVGERHRFTGNESDLRMRFNEALAGGANMNGDSGSIIHTDGHAQDLNRAIGVINELRLALASLQAGEAAPVVESAQRVVDAVVGSNADGCVSALAAYQKCCSAARAALSTTPAQPDQTAQGVPEGCRLVPIEPTAEMIHEGRVAQHWGRGASLVHDVWSAMLSTAPHPEEWES